MNNDELPGQAFQDWKKSLTVADLVRDLPAKIERERWQDALPR